MTIMRIVQLIVLIFVTAIALVFEIALRTCLFPMAIVVLIIMQLCGLKSTIKSNAWISIWEYSMPWVLDRYYIADAVIKHLSPEGF